MTESGEDATTVPRASLDLPEAPAAFLLRATAGADAGKTFAISDQDPLPALIGQSQVCVLRLNDREVSRRHASLDIDGRSLRIRDLGSTNGTSVDGVPVIEALLRPGQTISLGKTTLTVSRRDAPAPERVDRRAFGRVIGESAEMRRLYPLLDRLAAAVVPVIIEGETGTGKELVAEAIHEQGPRALAPFVVFDCANVVAAAVDAELFGSAGPPERKGLFEQANGGTLLLDKVDQLDIAHQPKLLRVLERGEVTPIGAAQRVRVDVRILATTDRDLDQQVQTGRFREDLYHRIAVARVELPPLRRRHGDIQLLAQHFLHALKGGGEVDARTLSAWRDAAWPGNVRELRNAVARMVALGDLDGTTVAAAAAAADAKTPRHFLEELGHIVDEAVAAGVPLARGRERVTEMYDRLYVERVLAHHGGNAARAADAAGIGRRYFQMLRARMRG